MGNEELSCLQLSVTQGKLPSCHIPALGLGPVGGGIIVPELGLPVCHGSCLAYLELDTLASPPLGLESRLELQTVS
jgi:hypothetical protein